MIRTLAALLALVGLISCGAYAGEKHSLSATAVTAYGEASADESNAKEKAIADALRNAVMGAIGAYVEAETIGENYREVKDQILVKASGFATLDRIESTSVTDGIVKVKISATVSNRPLVEKLKALGLTHEWKVGVYIPEKYTSKPQPVPDPAAETAIMQALLKSGFRVLDEAQRRQLQDDEAASRASEGDAAALRNIKREYGVDIFITGEAFAEYVDEATQGGVKLYRSRGRIEARAYYTDTAELVSMTDAFADGLDQTENLSSKQCFKNLGEKAGSVICEDILLAPSEMTPFITVKITNLKSISDASKLQKAVASLPGVSQVKRDRYTSGVLELNVYVKSEYRDELPERFEKCGTAKKLGLTVDIWSKTYMQGRVAKS